MGLSILTKLAFGLLLAALPAPSLATPAPVAAEVAVAQPAATSVVRPLARGFLDTCGDYSNTDVRINARCRQTVGIGLSSASLNLDICLGNDNGRLTYPGQGFSYSCTGCRLTVNTRQQQAMWTCNCEDISKRSRSSSIDLNTILENYDGDLNCMPDMDSLQC